jgi:TetR/AcrR family transcriptional repressor of nem operon
MARTAQPDSPTKERLLDAAQELMLAKGFAATTVDEICEAAELTKGSFFHYFESKDELGKQLLERFCADGAKLHATFCQSNETDPLKRVYNYIDGAIKIAKDPVMSKGCLLGLFAQELCDTNPQIRDMCKKGFDDWGKTFGEELARAKARYAPQAAFEPRELADHLIAVMEGSMILGKTRRNMGVMAQNLEHFKAYVRGLFGASA